MFIEKTITTDGQQWYYRKAGKGTAVVLIHGLAEDSQTWAFQQEFLQQHFTVIVPDLPGSGHSPADSYEWSMEMFAAGLNAILIEEHIEKAIVIGHSMGGYVALTFADKYPEKMLGLGLFHSTAYADSEERIIIRRRAIQFIQDYGAAKYLEQATPNLFAEETRNNNPDLVQQITDRYADFSGQSLISYHAALMRRSDRTAVLQRIEQPVLFVIGEFDNSVPPAQVLPQTILPAFSSVEILSHSGHMGMFEETARSNKLLYDFCDACQKVLI
ncbi:alpha/beta hydrolase [Pseudoflavitalea sp. G-6-1-2]|uniref:alpha/beta fold hydrolase n=1 Tax=Pseudoflavitalea sp. G-6-1-2 TaxID=2728841 RepID=UPI00146A1C4E|nr:alpha/beta hydrolase [Pseudoflavitalea sp. G-6-1-2]NML22694.1 alpha/beta hydrolase [Pseudoflavitalea sp. G-6-1-2]